MRYHRPTGFILIDFRVKSAYSRVYYQETKNKVIGSKRLNFGSVLAKDVVYKIEVASGKSWIYFAPPKR